MDIFIHLKDRNKAMFDSESGTTYFESSPLEGVFAFLRSGLSIELRSIIHRQLLPLRGQRAIQLLAGLYTFFEVRPQQRMPCPAVSYGVKLTG